MSPSTLVCFFLEEPTQFASWDPTILATWAVILMGNNLKTRQSDKSNHNGKETLSYTSNHHIPYVLEVQLSFLMERSIILIWSLLLETQSKHFLSLVPLTRSNAYFCLYVLYKHDYLFWSHAAELVKSRKSHWKRTHSNGSWTKPVKAKITML